jgi:hypothetical protein
MTVKKYQKYCKNKLDTIYQEVQVEWNPFKGCEVSNKQYCPRLDMAVGPFAINNQFREAYTDLLCELKSKAFIESLIRANNQNIIRVGRGEQSDLSDFYSFNLNARCFMCVEIENKVSRKHIAGGLVNASALGRVAVLIAWTPDKLKAFIKLKNYLKYLSSVEKNSFKTNNILILDKDQFKELVDSAARS